MTTESELAAGRVRALTKLTLDLTARLNTEIAAFEARRPQDIAGSVAQTQELANTYRRDSAQVKANPAILAPAPASDRMALIEATRAFEGLLSRHARAVEAARIISEGLVRTIAAEVTAQRAPASGYGAQGQANAGDGRAFAMNRTA